MGFRSEYIYRGDVPEKKDWIPERTFQHSDFGGKKKNPDPPNGKSSGPAGSPFGESPGTDSGQKSATESSRPGQPGLHAFTPRRVDRNDPGVLPGRKDDGPEKTGKRNESESRTGREGTRKGSPGGPRVLPDRFITNAIYSHPERSMEILRSWYWEKPGPGMGEPYRRVHPHLRIFIVLSSAGAEAVRFLYGLFTPVERGQIHEILKSFPPVDPREVDLVRRSFIEKLTMDF